jgi:hypothetical protein
VIDAVQSHIDISFNGKLGNLKKPLEELKK